MLLCLGLVGRQAGLPKHSKARNRCRIARMGVIGPDMRPEGSNIRPNQLHFGYFAVICGLDKLKMVKNKMSRAQNGEK